MLLLTVVFEPDATAFVHPGGVHTQADFDRMAAKVAAGESPWIDSYNQLAAVAEAKTNWSWAPAGQINRCGSGCVNNFSRSQKDALAIYYNALRYWITGDENFANHAIQGMDAWSSTMTNGVGGDSNWALGAGICGYEFAVAGEALHGYSGWSQDSMNAYSNFLMLFYGGNHWFLVNHNGTCPSHYRCNWDACNIASMMAIGVFCDRQDIFDEAVNYYEEGIGNGNITRAAWYIHSDGSAQWEESGRDQAHTGDGVGWLAVACQVAWNQGVDLYGFDNNRFLRGAEYVAKYNLSNDVPYVTYLNCDNITETVVSSGSRGTLFPYWDMIYNHYVNVQGLAAPYSAQAAAKLRPDGFYNNPNSPDFLGFSTLTCLLDPISSDVPPSGVTANVSAQQVALTWWGSANATSYNIKSSTVSGGPYTTIGTVSSSDDLVYVDSTVANGGTYYYVVSAVTPSGETPDSSEAVAVINQLAPYYAFDESSGTTAYDSSGYGLDATLINGPIFTTGLFGNAVSLSGPSSQYVALPPQVVGGLGDFTIAGWVNLNTVSAWDRIFDFGASSERYMFLTPEAGSGGPVRFAITTAGGRAEEHINGTAALGAGDWHHLAVTLTGSEGAGVGILYVDGAPVGTNSTMFHTPGMIGELINDTNNWIGRSQYTSDPYLDGMVDDFRIYNYGMSSDEISALASGTPPLPPAPTGLAATAISGTEIDLSWTDDANTGNYNVYQSTVSGGPYTLIASGIVTTSYADTGPTEGTTYYYVVTAVNGYGESPYSNEASATPP